MLGKRGGGVNTFSQSPEVPKSTSYYKKQPQVNFFLAAVNFMIFSLL